MAKEGMQVIALAVKPEYTGVDKYITEDEKFSETIGDFAHLTFNQKKEIINLILSPNGLNMIVAPKEVDIDIENLSEVLSGAIDHAVHELA